MPLIFGLLGGVGRCSGAGAAHSGEGMLPSGRALAGGDEVVGERLAKQVGILAKVLSAKS
ncbi:hypothetical protein [Tepidimonas aquatica]|uniref:hypothetical protein n=1 Tax=Tepidimonas aquatica TaxID=247482 RepID=UPI0011854FD6|nr:hypothetical protein [Tepidimonas aquatica]